MSANKRTTIRFQELNQKKYRTPLIVTYSYLLISYPISVSSAVLQWVQGRAGEDRVYIVVSKEQGWVFVAIYDGFNDSDAPDYLVPHPYALCTVRSVACSGISASKRSSTTLINIVMEHKLVYIRSIRIFGEISNCLFLGCTFHSVTGTGDLFPFHMFPLQTYLNFSICFLCYGIFAAVSLDFLSK
jgi:hypothetical protein